MSFTIKNGDNVITGDFSKLDALVKNLKKKYYVDIGILGKKNKTVEGGLTLAGIGAVQVEPFFFAPVINYHIKAT